MLVFHRVALETGLADEGQRAPVNTRVMTGTQIIQFDEEDDMTDVPLTVQRNGPGMLSRSRKCRLLIKRY